MNFTLDEREEVIAEGLIHVGLTGDHRSGDFLLSVGDLFDRSKREFDFVRFGGNAFDDDHLRGFAFEGALDGEGTASDGFVLVGLGDERGVGALRQGDPHRPRRL